METDPSRRLGDLRFPETQRSRKLAQEEIGWFLQALVDEERDYQRGMLLWLLTAARLAEVSEARTAELADHGWSIPGSRTKNSVEHRIALGPWGWSRMQSNSEWVFPAPKRDGPRSRSFWYKARDRVKAWMEELARRPIERFTPHDFRRTSRSNTKRLKVDFETEEAMLNHVKKGLERTYHTYELEEEKRAWFLKWEHEIAEIARRAGVAGDLAVHPVSPAEYKLDLFEAPQCSAASACIPCIADTPKSDELDATGAGNDERAPEVGRGSCEPCQDNSLRVSNGLGRLRDDPPAPRALFPVRRVPESNAGSRAT